MVNVCMFWCRSAVLHTYKRVRLYTLCVTFMYVLAATHTQKERSTWFSYWIFYLSLVFGVAIKRSIFNMLFFLLYDQMKAKNNTLLSLFLFLSLAFLILDVCCVPIRTHTSICAYTYVQCTHTCIIPTKYRFLLSFLDSFFYKFRCVHENIYC